MTVADINKDLTDAQLIRYYRQILLPQVQESGQTLVLQHHVLIVGVGGLGNHVAQQLAAAGVGHIHLMDDDRVEISNLPRQVLFGPKDLGQDKVQIAKEWIERHCENAVVSACKQKFSPEFADIYVKNHAVLQEAINQNKLLVLDCSDNMHTRQGVNRWCVGQQLPLVSAAISAFDGQLLLIDAKRLPQAGCYHCIFSQTQVTQDCASMGVLGPAVAVVASMQALLAIKSILQIPSTETCLYIFDGLSLGWRQLNRNRDPSCPICQHWPQQTSISPCHEGAQLC